MAGRRRGAALARASSDALFSDRRKRHGLCPACTGAGCPAGSQGLPPPSLPAPTSQAQVRISWMLLVVHFRTGLGGAASGIDAFTTVVDQNASRVLSPN